MAFSVTQPNFTGKAAAGYISAALKEAKSLEFLTVLENIKYKENIQKMDGSGLVKDSDCNAFTSAGDLSLTEATLEPKSLQINLAICKATLLTSYEALQMRAGRDAMPSVSFEDYVISYIGEIIADATEKSIWRGVATNNGEFNGFNGFTLLPANDATVVQSSASAAYTAGTAADVLHKDDAYIFMNRKTYQFYIQAMSTLNYMNMSQMNADYQPFFEGIKIAVVDGMIDNQLVFAESSNLFFGTDLLSDHTRISLLDQSVVTGSDNINLVARYTAGVIQGIGANVVRQS